MCECVYVCVCVCVGGGRGEGGISVILNCMCLYKSSIVPVHCVKVDNKHIDDDSLPLPEYLEVTVQYHQTEMSQLQ